MISLKTALTSYVQDSENPKTDIVVFARNVKMHDEAKCSCKLAVDRPSKSISYHSDHGKHFLLEYPLEYGTARPLDWVVVLFGACSPMVLRPDCRIQPDPWKLTREHQHMHVSDHAFQTSRQGFNSEVQSSFVLTRLLDSNGRGQVSDRLDTYIQ